MSSTDRPSLAKQLLGAVVGGSLALGIFTLYRATPDNVTALILPQSWIDARTSDEDVRLAVKTDPDHTARIANQARRIVERYQDEPEPPPYAPEDYDVVIEEPESTIDPQPTEEEVAAVSQEWEELEQAVLAYEPAFAEASADKLAFAEAAAQPSAYEAPANMPDPEPEITWEPITATPPSHVPHSGVGLAVVGSMAFAGTALMRLRRRHHNFAS